MAIGNGSVGSIPSWSLEGKVAVVTGSGKRPPSITNEHSSLKELSLINE